MDIITTMAESAHCDPRSEAFASHLDSKDDLAAIREQFCIPKRRDALGEKSPSQCADEAIYLCGNSLGLMPVAARKLVNEELDTWATSGVSGHHEHPHGRSWIAIDEQVVDKMATIVGAEPGEVAVMGSLTANLNQMLVSFYHPTLTRYKIIIEGKAFPSDQYAIESHIRLHKRHPDDCLIAVFPRKDEFTLRTEDIVAAIQQAGDSLALVMFSGVQYYTGQFFDISSITKAGHAVGANVGWDLAHAVGNVPLKLHDWNVDFAVWCTYKYLNAGPGAIGALFLHERHAHDFTRPRFAGWWGSKKETRFLMSPDFQPTPGAYGYQMSNPSVLNTVCLLASLNVFELTTFEAVRKKSILLTGYLEYLLCPITDRSSTTSSHPSSSSSTVRPESTLLSQTPSAPSSPSPSSAAIDVVRIATPKNPEERGSQLSLIFRNGRVKEIFDGLAAAGIVCDKREPDCIRIAPVPLYNTFHDVWTFVDVLIRTLEDLK